MGKKRADRFEGEARKAVGQASGIEDFIDNWLCQACMEAKIEYVWVELPHSSQGHAAAAAKALCVSSGHKVLFRSFYSVSTCYVCLRPLKAPSDLCFASPVVLSFMWSPC